MNTARERALVPVLAILFFVAVAWSAVRPVNPHDYWLEIATPLGMFVVLAAVYRWFRFTPLASALIFLEMMVLVVGAHYTHELVPLFEWIKHKGHLQRNHYDRFAHFFVGFSMVVVVREILRRKSPLRGAWLASMSVVSILAFAAFYELTEWWIAEATSPETGAAYLGSQGDVWDAQKDMLMDWIGAIAGVLTFSRLHEGQIERLVRARAAGEIE